MIVSKELILKARRADLVDFLLQKGHELKREGKNWRLPGYGGLVVKGNGYYHFSTRTGGNALDFCLKVLNMGFREAVLGLNGVLQTDISMSLDKGKERKLEMPARFRNEHRVIAYLTKSRGLPASMVVELIRTGLLYQDDKGNAVFVCRDATGQDRGAVLQGTVTEIRWKGLAAGSDTGYGWFWPGLASGFIDTVTVIESPIDAMSLAVIKPNIREGHILALGGLHREALEGFLNRNNILKVVLALDNDIWGRDAAAEWQEWLLDEGYTVLNLMPTRSFKNWNEMLKN